LNIFEKKTLKINGILENVAKLHKSIFVKQNAANHHKLTARISNCESAQEAWQILETTYEGTKLV
jgi:hypothetical protein